MLRLLGKPKQTGAGTFPARGYELVAVATLSPNSRIDRSELSALLWPNATRERGYGSLRYALSMIRKWEQANGVELLEITPDSVRAIGNTDLHYTLSGLDSGDFGCLPLALSGELLENHVGLSDGLDGWLSTHRTKLNEQILRGVLQASSAGDDTEMGPIIGPALQRFPYEEELLKVQLLRLVSRGRHAVAAVQIEAFRSRLKADLGIDLSPDMQNWIANTLAVADAVPRDMLVETRPVSLSGLPRVVLVPPVYGGSRANRALANSVVAEVTSALCRLRTFAMFAPLTAKRIASDDAEDRASSLGADYFISTELITPARLHFRLVHMTSRRLLCAEVLDLTDASMAAEEFARAIGALVSQHIAATELSNYRRSGEAGAFVHYLLGCERLSYDLAAVRRSRKHFLKALDLSPHFVQAKAMVARTLNMEWLLLARQETELLDHAEQISREAVNVDPLAPSGHWELGNTLLYRQRMDESLHHVRSARNRAPHLADLLSDEADVLVHLGEGETARDRISKALYLNPLAPDEYRWVQGSADFISGDFQAALDNLRKMKDQRPVARILAASAAMVGERSLATKYRRMWLERYPDFRVEDWIKVIPVKKQETIDRMVEGMRKAGFS